MFNCTTGKTRPRPAWVCTRVTRLPQPQEFVPHPTSYLSFSRPIARITLLDSKPLTQHRNQRVSRIEDFYTALYLILVITLFINFVHNSITSFWGAGCFTRSEWQREDMRVCFHILRHEKKRSCERRITDMLCLPIRLMLLHFRTCRNPVAPARK